MIGLIRSVAHEGKGAVHISYVLLMYRAVDDPAQREILCKINEAKAATFYSAWRGLKAAIAAPFRFANYSRDKTGADSRSRADLGVRPQGVRCHRGENHAE